MKIVIVRAAWTVSLSIPCITDYYYMHATEVGSAQLYKLYVLLTYVISSVHLLAVAS